MKDHFAVVETRSIVRKGIIDVLKEELKTVQIDEYESIESLVAENKFDKYTKILFCIDNQKKDVMGNMLKKIKDKNVSCKLLVYNSGSINNDIEILKHILPNIDGYISDIFNNYDLSNCIRFVQNGQRFISTEIVWNLLKYISEQDSLKSYRLSKKEGIVARHLVKGLSVSHIAALLQLKSSTVSTIKKNILTKTRVTNVIDLANMLDDKV